MIAIATTARQLDLNRITNHSMIQVFAFMETVW